jgi:hypothetical protein
VNHPDESIQHVLFLFQYDSLPVVNLFDRMWVLIYIHTRNRNFFR